MTPRTRKIETSGATVMTAELPAYFAVGFDVDAEEDRHALIMAFRDRTRIKVTIEVLEVEE